MQSALPIVSIIIPSTGNRPQLLRRAIDSALEGWQGKEVEVIVVFNGTHENHVTDFSGVSNIRAFSIPQANACDARNYGLEMSIGELVRFLDDDDFLIPAIAVKQCRELLASTADISSYAAIIHDEEGRQYGELRQPLTSDFVAGQLSLNGHRGHLPFTHVCYKTAIGAVRWKPEWTVAQDTAWLLSLAAKRDFSWIKSDDVVGVWYQHRFPRISYAHPSHEPHRVTAESILGAVSQLQISNRMTKERQRAALSGLWECIHRGFYLKPFYWHRVAKIALRMERQADEQAGKVRKFLWIPLAVQWLVLPKRKLNHLARKFRAILFGWNHVRHL
jgi:glycosyltransferase involved in cell wall biosynthesis